MAEENASVSSITPEMFTRPLGEITESKDDVSLFRVSGEEVPAIKGAKLYLNDTIITRNDSAVLVNLGVAGVLVLGQNQQVTLHSEFFKNIDPLSQSDTTNFSAQNAAAQAENATDIAALQLAIQSGQNIEELLAPTAAGVEGTNQDGASSIIIFYQRIGSSLIPVSGFGTSSFGGSQFNTTNEFGDLDRNNQVNDAPVARNDSFIVNEDGSLTLNPLANDTDPDAADILSIISVNGVSLSAIGTPQTIAVPNGSVSINSVGVITFNPAANFNGNVSFPYVVSDPDGLTDTANMSITVTPVNDLPVALDDALTGLEDGVLTLNPLMNDTDLDGDTLSVVSINGVALNALGVPQTIAVPNGSVNISAVGVITFIPDANFNGNVSFPYVISDGTATATANELITVTPVNDRPIATPSISSGSEDTSINVSLAGTDIDGTVDFVTVTTLPSASEGVLTLADGTAVVVGAPITATQAASLVFTPPSNFNGEVIVTFTVTDNNGLVSSPANEVITVVAVSDGPIITLEDNFSAQPPSTGLVLNFYDNLRNNNRTAANQEAAMEAATPTSVSREINGFGTDKDVTNFNTFINDGSTIQIGTGDSYSVTGLIYLEAGSTYQFSGYHDDSLRIELGGQTLISTTGDSWGNYGPVGAPRNFVKGDAFTAPSNGYFTFEAYVNNVSGPGKFSINLIVDGKPSEQLDASNFNIYAGVDDLLAAGGQFGNFVTSTVNTDGGYFPQLLNTGASGHFIKLSNIALALRDMDGSESITGIQIRNIPVGATLTDGVNNFTATSGSTTADLLTDSWNLGSIQILIANGFVGVVNLTVAATTSEISNGNSSTSTQDLPVTVLDPATIASGIDPDIVSPDGLGASIPSSGDDFIVGSSANDDGVSGLGTLQGLAGNDAIHGGAGNDRLEGGNGADFLAGQSGADILIGGAGEDIIFGGAGSDSLAGGTGSDTFLWKQGDGDGSTDTIADFNLLQGDVLNLADFLQGEDPASLTNYLNVSFDSSTGNSTITVDAQGMGSGTDLTVILEGVDLSGLGVNPAEILQSLIDTNHLIVDQM
jgi:hypothetical protein